MSFSKEKVEEVWKKAYVVGGYKPNEFRKDQCGAWITRNHYGDRNSIYSWEIDHITPKSNGGGDEISNLRPLQYENNMSKSDGRLVCVVTSKGDSNVKKN